MNKTKQNKTREKTYHSIRQIYTYIDMYVCIYIYIYIYVAIGEKNRDYAFISKSLFRDCSLIRGFFSYVTYLYSALLPQH